MHATQHALTSQAHVGPSFVCSLSRAAAVLAAEAAGEGWSGLDRYESIMREMREQLHTMTARLEQLMVSMQGHTCACCVAIPPRSSHLTPRHSVLHLQPILRPVHHCCTRHMQTYVATCLGMYHFVLTPCRSLRHVRAGNLCFVRHAVQGARSRRCGRPTNAHVRGVPRRAPSLPPSG
jgi:hypothetical protein